MSDVQTAKSSSDYDSGSCNFQAGFDTKRDLLWTAFRKTVLEPRGIRILDRIQSALVPQELLEVAQEKMENLTRHEVQALQFVEAIAAGIGLDQSSSLCPDILPELTSPARLSRYIDLAHSNATIPNSSGATQTLHFDLPIPQPVLTTAFHESILTKEEIKELPDWCVLKQVADDTDDSAQGNQLNIVTPFLMFERTYGSARHEVESALNLCAINGSSALNTIQRLFDMAWPGVPVQPCEQPAVFTCALDYDTAVINHHWIATNGFFCMAPLIKFDFRDLEQFMQFAGWIEAIEEWASSHLLADIRFALSTLAETRTAEALMSVARALPSPVTDAEKQEKLSHSMQLAFENIPWKGQRARNTPLGATMRMRSPRTLIDREDIMSTIQTTQCHESVDQRHLSVPASTPKPIVAKTPVTALATSAKSPLTFIDQRSESHEETHSGSISTSPATTKEKRKRVPTNLMSIKSAALPPAKTASPIPRPATAGATQATESTGDRLPSRTVPVPRLDDGKSPGIITSTIEMKSPARSIMSMSSKRSFKSLRSGKSLRSPGTPDSNASPRGTGFKSKLTNGLDAIKERTTPKKVRHADNSVPSSAKEAPLPTPAYDKKRFEIRPPTAPTPPTPKFWEQAKIHLTPGSKAAAEAAYNSNHVLPFRQYAQSPTTATIKTTVMAGGV